MTQATISGQAFLASPVRANDRPSPWQRAKAALPVLLRLPPPGDGLSDDIRRILEEDDLNGREEYDDRPPGAPEAGWGAGLTLCIPSLVLIGILYSLLK